MKIHLTEKQWGRRKPNASLRIQIIKKSKKTFVRPAKAAGIKRKEPT